MCPGRPLARRGTLLEQIAETFQVSRQTVYNWANRFLRRDGLDLRAHLLDAPRRAALRRSPRSSTLDRGGLGPRSPPVRYHATVWTAQLLQQDLEQAHGIRASLKSISVAIARLHFRWKRPRHELAGGRDLAAGKRGLKRGLAGDAHRHLDAGRDTSPRHLRCITAMDPSVSRCGCRQWVDASGCSRGDQIRSDDLALLISEDWTRIRMRRSSG